MYLFRVSMWHLLFANIFLVLNIAATIALPVTVNELSVPPSSAVTRHRKGKPLPEIPTVRGHGRRPRPRPGVKLNFNQLQQYKLCLSRLKWDKDNRQYVRILESDQQLVDADPNEIWSMMFLPVVWEGHNQKGYHSPSYRTKVSEVSTEHMGLLYQWGPNTNGKRISLDDYPKLLVLGTVTMTLNLKRDVMEDVNTAVTENRINELPNLLSLFQYQSLIKKELDDRSWDPVRSSSIRGITFDLSRY
ncbi:hypothetical protein F5878DRAFT_358919 [Lentinula raphanica]|uniref:Uncharacterized protein n=1 Tax=Lentinula raphanica TaxID=153919 RepID=A0AA38UKZ5_9AGAR|nr:hypothetical protein F5880DRAFT_1536686 [Lentinula raphanica]KAJ3845205.1 hypothetical protein F5878DRAFT_358919 [Lentinula raphanica]